MSLEEALSYSHKTTVHRDIKPENIWISGDGTVRLMDFGIARLVSASRLTQTAMVLGTAYYMAPEQLQGSKAVDQRADQYAVAVVLYQMLTGDLPAGRMKSVSTLRQDVPAGLSEAIDQALEPQPDSRFPNMSEFINALKQGGRMGRRVQRQAKILASAALSVAAVCAFILFTPSGKGLTRYAVDHFRQNHRHVHTFRRDLGELA